jgi:hypothetical protein
MSKTEALTARLDLKVAPQILADLDIEISRLRLTKQMFGNRRPRHAALVMVAIKQFMTLAPELRDAAYDRWFGELSGETPATVVLNSASVN